MMRTLETSKGKKVNTPYSDDQALAVLRSNYGKLSSFGLDLVSKQFLSHDQRVWIQILAVELTTPRADAVKAAGIELKATLALLTGAKSSKLKNPSITFEWNGRTVELSLAGARASRPGTVNVTDGGPYGQNTWFGRINLTGVFEPSRSADSNVIDILVEFNENPAKYAAEYGRKTGKCCFCNASLYGQDGLSAAVGYGRTCAGHYGLPYGVEAAKAANEALGLAVAQQQESIESPAYA